MTDLVTATSYVKKISQAAPGLIVLVLDDSGSMAEALPGSSDPKYLWVERYFGIILKELLAKSTVLQGDTAAVKPRYYVKTFLYGTTTATWPAGETLSSPALDIEQTVRAFAGGDGATKNSLGLGGNLGGTDTDTAFNAVGAYLADELRSERFRDSFPPMVFHLSDGASATDATATAQRIRSLGTNDGNVLILNALIGTATSLGYKDADDFPGYTSAAEAGPDPDSIRLFNMASPTPDTIRANLVDDAIFQSLRDGSKLYFDVRTREMLKHAIQAVGSLGSRLNK